MSDIGVMISALATIVGIVIVIVILKLKVDPVIALVVGAIVLALVSGLTPDDAIRSLTRFPGRFLFVDHAAISAAV